MTLVLTSSFPYMDEIFEVPETIFDIKYILSIISIRIFYVGFPSGAQKA